MITLPQLRDAGLTEAAVWRRVSKGSLHRVSRGVYRVGHVAPSTDATYLAAVLACGKGAALCGKAGAFLYALMRGHAPAPEVATTRDVRVRGAVTHRVRRLDPRDVTLYRSIPVTTVQRVLVDLAARLDLDDPSRVCHEAAVKYDVRAAAVCNALARKPNSTGAWKLHEIFSGQHRLTLSWLEDRFLALLRSARLPLPTTNRHEQEGYVDCRWPDRHLTIELDSYRYHHTRHAWEKDRRRERTARARGDEFRRYTYGDVTGDAALVLDEVRPLLGRG